MFSNLEMEFTKLFRLVSDKEKEANRKLERQMREIQKKILHMKFLKKGSR